MRQRVAQGSGFGSGFDPSACAKRLIRRRSVLPTTSRLASGNDRLTMIHCDGTVEENVTQQGFTCHTFIHRCVARWNPGSSADEDVETVAGQGQLRIWLPGSGEPQCLI
jgi:hypothetical protein